MFSRWLEVETQSELNDAPTVCRVKNHAEGARSIGEIRIRITETDAVKDIEHVRAELQ